MTASFEFSQIETELSAYFNLDAQDGRGDTGQDEAALLARLGGVDALLARLAPLAASTLDRRFRRRLWPTALEAVFGEYTEVAIHCATTNEHALDAMSREDARLGIYIPMRCASREERIAWIVSAYAHGDVALAKILATAKTYVNSAVALYAVERGKAGRSTESGA